MEIGKDLDLFATIVWIVWHRMNAVQTSSNPFPVQQIQQIVRSLRAEFVRSLLLKPPDLGQTSRLISMEHVFKTRIYIAGAVAVIQDKNGQVLATMADKIS